MALLEVKNIKVYYGNINAIKDISFEVNEGEIVTLIGANGAGKSSILNTVAGLIKPKSGEIIFDGQGIIGIPAHKIVSKGMALCPEGRRIFQQLSVKENLEMGSYTRPANEVSESIEKVYELFPRLKERYKQIAGTLSGGEQQMLAVARALMTSPRLLLLDEPGLGLAPLIVQEIFSKIKHINEENKVTVFVVEQNARLALKSSNEGYVMENGVIVLHDEAKALLKNEKVRAAYLGE